MSKERVLGVVGIVFGLVTIREGGAVIFGDGVARLAAGDYVPFVVWFNFMAGFAYVAAGLGLVLRRGWAALLALAIAVATITVFAAFGVHVLGGGAYEMRTVFAMILRSVVWCAIALVAGKRRAT